MPTAAAEGKRPKGKHGVHVAASPGPDRFLFSDLPTREVKALIRAALPAGDPVKLVLAVTAKGRWRGWAKITAGDEARAAAAVAALDGAVVKLQSGAELSLRASRGLGRRDNVFPFLDRGLRESFALDDTAAYSVMDEHTTALLASFLACVYAGELATLAITDACACTGACAVVLARHFRAVDAVELDAGRCAALRKNVLLCGADVTVHQGDYNALWDTLRQDVVFLDVPWGGPDYVEAEGSACDALGDVPSSTSSCGSAGARRPWRCGCRRRAASTSTPSPRRSSPRARGRARRSAACRSGSRRTSPTSSSSACPARASGCGRSTRRWRRRARARRWRRVRVGPRKTTGDGVLGFSISARRW